MVRRSAPAKYYAERYFPVRVRVAVPPRGFGKQLDAMFAWLDQNVGKDGYYMGSEAGPGLLDAALFYFLDPKSAATFVDCFGCELVVGREAPCPAAVPR